MRKPALLGAFLLAGAGVGAVSTAAWGRSVIERYGRLKLNWGTMKVQFYGEAGAADASGDGYGERVKEAWDEGLVYAQNGIRDLNAGAYEHRVADTRLLSHEARMAADRVTRATYSFHTTYFADGGVRVHMESQLPKALATDALRFRQRKTEELTTMAHSGVVLRVDRPISPRPTYRVVSPSGAVLFDVTGMAQEAFHKRLMGPWFEDPTAEELSKSVGGSPLNIAVKVDSKGRFVVDRQQWREALEGLRPLLVNGRLAVVVPRASEG